MKIYFAPSLMSSSGYGVMSMKYVRKDGKVEFLNAGVSAGQEAVSRLLEYSQCAKPTRVDNLLAEFVAPDGTIIELVRKNKFHKDIFFISRTVQGVADEIIVPSRNMSRDTRKMFFDVKGAFLKLSQGKNI